MHVYRLAIEKSGIVSKARARELVWLGQDLASPSGLRSPVIHLGNTDWGAAQVTGLHVEELDHHKVCRTRQSALPHGVANQPSCTAMQFTSMLLFQTLGFLRRSENHMTTSINHCWQISSAGRISSNAEQLQVVIPTTSFPKQNINLIIMLSISRDLRRNGKCCFPRCHVSAVAIPTEFNRDWKDLRYQTCDRSVGQNSIPLIRLDEIIKTLAWRFAFVTSGLTI